MRTLKLAPALVVIAFFVSACGETTETTNTAPAPANSPAAAPAATPDSLASGRIHFEKNCAECHGAKGEGGPKEMDGKRFRVPSLREGHALKHTDEKFVVQITEGDDEMPAFKDKLTPAEINEVVQYIRKEFQGR